MHNPAIAELAMLLANRRNLNQEPLQQNNAAAAQDERGGPYQDQAGAKSRSTTAC